MHGNDVSGTRPLATRLDDAVAGPCGVWMIAGLFVDGWAHRNNKPETFFTPWHGILYSGFIASSLWLLKVVRSHQRPGVSWRTTIPAGYVLRCLGVAVFGIGAIGDLIWHQLLGVEADIEALLSPTHLVLLSGGLLMAAGPIASTNAREEPGSEPSWSSVGPLVTTVAFVVSLLQFFMMYLSPFVGGRFERDGFNDINRPSDIASMLVFTSITTLAALYVIRRGAAIRGAFIALLFVPAFLQTILDSFETFALLIGPAVAAVIAEITWPRVQRLLATSAARANIITASWWAGLTIVYWYGVFAGVRTRNPLSLTVHVWTGLPIFVALMATLIAVATDPFIARKQHAS